MRRLIFDTETTALIKNSLLPIGKQPQCIEFYATLLPNDESVGNYDDLLAQHTHYLIHPGRILPPDTTRITGITDDMLVGKLPFRAHAMEIAALIQSADVVYAHNLSYDKAVIDFEMARAGHSVQWPRGVCTVEATEFYRGHRLKLVDLYQELFGEPFTGAHRAEVDVAALTRCVVELIKRGDLS